MNLPQLTAKIGQAAKKAIGGNSPLAMLVENLSYDPDKDYILFMTFDLINQEIRFEEPTPVYPGARFDYHYFGNNSAASMQYFLTRDGDSIHYLLKSVLSDLYLVLKRNNMDNSELGSLLKQMNEQKLITLGEKQKTGTINLLKFKGAKEAEWDPQNDKRIVVNGVSKTCEDFVWYLLQWDNKDSSIALVIPRVITQDNKIIVLPQHPDYIAVTKIEQKLEIDIKSENVKWCYICHEKGTDISSEFTTEFNRSGINKVFGTTTINYAKNINKNNYDDNYAICNKCYQDMLFGEKEVSAHFSSKLAGERVFLLPEGLLEDIDYNVLSELKAGTDLLFDKGLTQTVVQQVEIELDRLNSDAYVIHFFLYRTDGNSVRVLGTISDVPTIHLYRLTEILGEQAYRLSLRSMSLGMIYRMIPVRTVKKDQIDVKRVFDVYQSLFKLIPLETNVLFSYATEALEKGFKELRKKRRTQYFNLPLDDIKEDEEDRYFCRQILSYLCLFHTCQLLGLLDRQIFYKKGVKVMETTDMVSRVQEVESFLEEQGFEKIPRALFYLGLLINSVAKIQYGKNHKTKPILNKINFQGMGQKEVVNLYLDVIEKLKQYNELTILNEQYMKAFNYYYGPLNRENETTLTDQERLFYILAGYSFYPAKPSKKENEDDNDEESQK